VLAPSDRGSAWRRQSTGRSSVAASSAQFRDIQFIVVAGRASGANVRHVAGHSAVTIRAAVSAAVSVAAAQEPAS